MLDKEKLESLLVANWTAFLNIREMLKLVKHKTGLVVTKLTLSRCQFITEGLLLWIEFETLNHSAILEAILKPDGQLYFLDDVESSHLGSIL